MLMNEYLDTISDNKISSPDIRIHDKYRNKLIQPECHLLAQGTEGLYLRLKENTVDVTK